LDFGSIGRYFLAAIVVITFFFAFKKNKTMFVVFYCFCFCSCYRPLAKPYTARLCEMKSDKNIGKSDKNIG
jgi:hypothetical protein